MNFFGQGNDAPLDNSNAPGYGQRMKEAAGQKLAGAKETLNSYWPEGGDPLPPPGKSGLMIYGCAPTVQESYPDGHKWYKTLEFALANDYRWSGNLVLDFFFFVCQWHPLLGILLAHPNHPWTKIERLQMVIISLALTMPMAAVITRNANNALTIDLDRSCYADPQCINTAEDPCAPSTLCLAGITAAKLTATIIFVTIPDVVIGVVLYQLSIAHTRCPTCCACKCGPCFSMWGCFRCIKKACMGWSLFLGAISAFICYEVLKLTIRPDHGWDEIIYGTLKTLAQGKVISYLTWFPIWMFLPCIGYLHQWYCLEAHTDGTQQGVNADQVASTSFEDSMPVE